MRFTERTPLRARRVATLGFVLGATGAALMVSPASAHTATASGVSVCYQGAPATSVTWANDWEQPATITAGTYKLTLPAMGTVTQAFREGRIIWSAKWTDGYRQESGEVAIALRTDCVPPVSNAPSTTAKAVPVAPPTTVAAVVSPAVEIGTATVLERPVEQPTELARTGRNTVWTVLAGFGFVVFGAAFAIVEKMMG
jgi:hypothetical protein